MIDYVNRRYKGVDNGFGLFVTYTYQYEENPIILVDDYGNNWYRCQFSYRLIPSCDVIIYGALIPNLNVKYYYHKDMKEYRKIQVREFNEFERNCNTCKNLTRIKHNKDSSGFLYGKCNSEHCDIRHPLLYNSTKEKIQFHPHDHMDMSCYEPRA